MSDVSTARPVAPGVPPLVQAVTFDWWGTLYVYADARARRLQLLHDFLSERELSSDRRRLEAVYAGATQHLDREWRAGRTYRPAQWLARILAELGFPAGEVAPEELLVAMEEAMLERPPLLADGAADLLADLHRSGIRLGIISDTALTVGRVMRRLLARDGILDYFTALVFSDETGLPKPHRRAFEAALGQLGVPAAQAAHVGDLPETDIAGAKGAGMRAVLVTGISGREDTGLADVVVRDFAELRRLFEGWGLLARAEHPGLE